MFDPEPGLMIWTVVSFLLLLVLLKKFAYKPILELMEGREKAIRKAIDDSEKSRSDSDALLLQYKQQLEEGHLEVQKIIEEGRSIGEKLKREIVEKADAESKALVKKAQEEIQREQKRALMALQEQVADLSVQVATKIIGQTLQQEDHENLIRDALEKVKEDYAKAG